MGIPDPYEVLLLLGGNMGEPVATLGAAEKAIGARCGNVIARSRDHWTEPWGFSDERLFLNRALLLNTPLEPSTLMAELLSIERDLGRVRDHAVRFSARIIDIDILLIGSKIIATNMLTVPHPRLHERAFALGPAADLVPQWMHPILGRTVLQLLHDLRPQH